MGNIIPFKNIDISKISDDLFDEIENYLKECFNKEIRKSSGNIPIFEAKKNAIKLVSKKFNLTLENAIEIVREIELRDLDNNLKSWPFKKYNKANSCAEINPNRWDKAKSLWNSILLPSGWSGDKTVNLLFAGLALALRLRKSHMIKA